MADETPEKQTKKPKSKGRFLTVLVGAVLVSVAGAGGYLAASQQLLPLPELGGKPKEAALPGPADDLVFVPLQPLIITLGRDANNTHLRFNAQLEVDPRYQDEVARLEPRFLDVLNGYLQALEARDIEDPSAFIRVRAQLLRRMQVVAGEGRVKDLLITEFVLN